MKYSLHSLFLCLLFTSTQLFSQMAESPCLHQSKNYELRQATPAMQQQVQEAEERLERFTEEFAQNIEVYRQADILTIPIVFHIVHDNGVENISDAQIIDAVAQLNEDFTATNPETANVAPAFANNIADVGLQFALAELDPNGNPTTGITRTQSSITYNGGSVNLKQLIRWPREMYLNVWVVYSSDGGNGSGFAFYPYSTEGSNEIYDGVVASYWAIGRTGTAISSHYKLLTHEVGHWANLKHTWGDDTNFQDANGCNYDDDVSDTPNTTGNSSCDLSASSCSSLDNIQNYMDYSDCSMMFTEGQKTRMLAAMNSNVGERDNLWSEANLAATLINGVFTPRVLYTAEVFTEDIPNDGSIANSINIELYDESFIASSGTMSAGTHYNIANLPAGLSLDIEITSSTTAIIALYGMANSHVDADDIANLEIAFTDAVFASGNAAQVLNATKLLNINFLNPYEIVYLDIDPDISTVIGGSTWTLFSLGVGNAEYGNWLYDDNMFKLETYDKPAVCYAGTRNIVPLPANTEVGSNSNFEYQGGYPDQLDVSNPSYTDWNGQTAYIGISFEITGNTHYGWLRCNVSANGDTFTILDAAYNEEPFAPLMTGETENSILSYSSENFEELSPNDGTTFSAIDLTLFNETFAGTGNLTEGTHYNATNVPSGLTLNVAILSNTAAQITLSGTAAAHTDVNNINDIAFSLNNNIFTTGNAANIEGSSTTLGIDFQNPYTVIYTDIEDLTVSTTGNTWEYFAFYDENNQLIGNAEYGLWLYDSDMFKLETYDKAAVCESQSRDITPMAANEWVGDYGYLNTPGGYPDQLDICNPNYTYWYGQTAYVGIVFQIGADDHYGWLRLQVASNGTSVTLLDMAYYTEPNAPILTGDLQDDFPPTALFSVYENDLTANDYAYFYDESTNNPTEWLWTFEGGTPSTSTEQDPTVQYQYNGTYAVTLTATNAYGSNTATVTNYITVTGGEPNTEYCASTSGSVTYEWIEQVQFGDFVNASDAQVYSDFTTAASVNFTAGNAYASTITPNFYGDPSQQFFNVWIDFNGDFDFADAGELVFSDSNTAAVSGMINIPDGLDITTRMRVAMKYYYETEGPCETFDYGEVEDYTVVISPAVLACEAPVNLTEPVINPPSLTLAWDAVPTATSYEIAGRKASKPWKIFTTNTNSRSFTGIVCGKTYEWAVRALCDNGNYTEWSVIKTFSSGTCKNGETNAANDPFDGETNMLDIAVYPNPASQNIHIVYQTLGLENNENEMFELTLYDITGKLLMTETHNFSAQNANFSLNVAHLLDGYYLLHINNGTSYAVEKIVVKH
ncbi:MAG: M43 family zinc metalloprotease [Chitinophagales bacterium]